ncbi:AAA family ATPase [Xanthovirga aplysinae]|uniref:AAA family ATPase n=1 Tax=Xanthovirga aplysinae TaxID=2529853 RepID=UPI0012BBC0A7|nr:AAA family ATPase [Xanthovirga aplysinae]MTI32298.1 hypothetical protein [Xanthovirga aplysinae]
MKILVLRFKNINSLKGEFTLDFTKSSIAQSGLFAITGPTGAGKSTILDIITLALFNRIPRVPVPITKNYITENGAILTRGTKDCFAEIDYEVKGRQYRSYWSIEINRRGNLNDYKMEISTLPEGELMDLKRSACPDKNASLIGLNYNQFIKAILLSQGEFARFLKAKRDERSDLLEKITKSFDFRQISIAVFERFKEEQEKIQQKKSQMEGYDLLPEEQLKEIEKELHLKQSEYYQQQEIFTKLQDKIKLSQTAEDLQEKLEGLKEKIETNEKENQAQRENYLRLDQHESVLPLRPNISLLKEKIRILQIDNKKMAQFEQDLKSFDLKQRETKNEWERLSLAIEQEEKAFFQLKQLCVQIDAKDHQLDLLKQNSRNLISQKNKITSSIQQFEHDKKNIKCKIQNGRLEINDLETWFSNHADILSLTENFAFLQQKGEALKDLEQSFLRAIKENDRLNQSLKGKKTDVKAKYIRNFVKEAESNLLENNSKLKDKQLDLSQYELRIELLNNFLRNHQELIQKKDKLLKIQAKQNNHRELLDKIGEGLKTANANKEILQLKLEELQLRQRRFEIEASLEKHREKLKEGEKCPLCGSTHHPYKLSYEKQKDNLDDSISNSQKEFEKWETLHQDLIQRKIKNENGLLLLTDHLEEGRKEINVLEKFGNEIQKELPEVFSEEIVKKIHESPVLQCEDLIREWTNQKKFKLESVKLEQGLSRLKLIQGPLINYETQQVQFFQETNAYLKNQDFSSSKQVIDYLESLNQEINLKKERVEALKQKTRTDKEVLAEKQQQSLAFLKEESALNAQIVGEKQKISQGELERKELFGDKQTAKELEYAQDKLENLKTRCSSTKEELAKISSQISSTKEQRKHLTETISSNQRKIEELKKRVQNEIQLIGFNNLDQVEGFLLKSKEVLEIKNKKEKLKEERINLFGKREGLKGQLQDVKISLENISPLKQLVEEANNFQVKLKELLDESADLKATLSKNSSNRSAFENLKNELQNLENSFSKWKMLNEYIGSRDGKKFNNYAQDLVVQNLLVLANRRLEKLNDRYRFTKAINNKESSDDLYVIDRYMGDNRRSVRTLSGGESFLMSLALALSLSDMAGKNANIESLFIDEGFGTLDEETLDMAMTTLENLQAESKKTIGLISHVAAIKERIGAKIEIQKGNSGFSTLQIH